MSRRKIAAAIAEAIIDLGETSDSEEEVEWSKRVWVCDFLLKRNKDGFFAKLWSEFVNFTNVCSNVCSVSAAADTDIFVRSRQKFPLRTFFKCLQRVFT